jgi:hypothetical protein
MQLKKLILPVGIVLAAFQAVVSAADAKPSSSTNPSSAQTSLLVARGDAAIQGAVKGAQGWGWEERGNVLLRRSGKPIINTPLTATTGIGLLWAGQLLGDAKYQQAALEAARGVASVQTHSGQIRLRGAMGAVTGAKDLAAEVPDRAPTRAALAVILLVIDSDRDIPKVQGLRSSATHAAHWMLSQQGATGAWPMAFPPGAAPGKGTRLCRLDDRDYRDTSLAMLLASEVLQSKDLARGYSRAANALVEMRVPAPSHIDHALWGPAYTLGGEATERIPELFGRIDLLACRYAMETLLAGYLVTGKAEYDEALEAAAAAIRELPRDRGKLHRRYDRRGRPVFPATREAPEPGSFRDAPLDEEEDAAQACGINPLLDIIEQISRNGGPKVAKSIEQSFSMRQRIAVLLCGRDNDALIQADGVDPRDFLDFHAIK